VNIRRVVSAPRISNSENMIEFFMLKRNSSKTEKLMLQIEVAMVAKRMNSFGILFE
jgi:hypothetical protein